MKYSLYYQAHIQKELSWLLTSAIRFSEHVAFDRTVDKQESIFEFYVAPDLEDVFLDIMKKLAVKNVVLRLEKMPNRLMYEEIV